MFKLIFLLHAVFLPLLLGPFLMAKSGPKENTPHKKSSLSQKIGIVLQPYTGNQGDLEISPAPNFLYDKFVTVISEENLDFIGKTFIRLTPEEDKDYGGWHRVSMADAHLGRVVASMTQDEVFSLGILGNCNSLWGMLAGLQHAGPGRKPLKVGLVWLDAHGDFNTPETTLSGWLGGMPVAVAAGKCLSRLRMTAGLDPPISTRHIIMIGLRDVDPLEQVLIDESHIISLSPEEMLKKNKRILSALEQLSRTVDVIYVHIDLDVLDASEIPGHNFEVPGGPTASETAKIVRFLMHDPKVKALGIASFPTVEQGRTKSLESTLKLLRGAMKGLKERKSQ